MKKISTKELAKKIYDTVIGLGIKNHDLALILTFKHLRYLGVDCDLLEISPSKVSSVITRSVNVLLIIKFNNEEEVMRSDSLFVKDNYKDWFSLDASGIELSGIKPAQLYFAKVNTGMFKV